MIWKYMKTNFKEFRIWIIKAPERDEIDGILYYELKMMGVIFSLI